MKLIRYRKPSLNTLLGITKAKRSFARATGIPTTKSGRKRKVMNALTGGAYYKYQSARAAVNRPKKHMKRFASCLGCALWLIGTPVLLCLVMLILFL